MSLPILIRRPAQVEFDNAIEWYNQNRDGKGPALADAVQNALDVIADQPDRYPEVFEDTREAPVSGFPYCVYDQVEPNRIVVLSVFHTSRDPNVWQSRA